MLLGCTLVASCALGFSSGKIAPRVVNPGQHTGLQAVDCWFGGGFPAAECYRMWVPETHGSAGSRLINFPVVIFRSDDETEKRPPLLHLGGGGPGAPMYLGDRRAIEFYLSWFSHLSLEQGRDLVLIDPRGSGLAEPLLTCEDFIANERVRMRQNLTLRAYMLRAVVDDASCIDAFLADGVDLSAYNSFSVAEDVEALRKAAGLERWALYGGSYAANYALALADGYPASVESMILDSAYISKIGLHEYFVESNLRPFRLLFEYCALDPECREPIDNVRKRFWDLHDRLDSDPLMVEVELENGEQVELLLNGHRLIDTIMIGIYEPRILLDFHRIVAGLEQGDLDSLQVYLQDYVDYMLDPDWADISMMTHYCYEEKPGIDFVRIDSLLEQLPGGAIREYARLGLEWPDHCERMRIVETAPRPLPSRKLEIPTLFLHGQLDLVTPVDNVRRITDHFDDFHLLILDFGHGLMGKSACAHEAATIFLYHSDVTTWQLHKLCE